MSRLQRFYTYLFRTGTIQIWTLSLQILNRKDTGDMLWAWQLHVTTHVISLQHNHATQLTFFIDCPPLPDYQQHFTHNAKQNLARQGLLASGTAHMISQSFQTGPSKLPLVCCLKRICDLVKEITCAEVWASSGVLCFLSPHTERPPKSLGRMSGGLIAVFQFIAIPCEMQCVPLKVLFLALKYLPQHSYFKWQIMQLWRQ